MRPHGYPLGILLLSALCLALCNVASSQAPLEPPQLPARTTFYLIWRGAPAAELRKTNSVMSLWDDPDFAPVRAAVVDSMLNDAKKPKGKPALTRDQLSEYVTLLENPFTIGYLPRREGSAPKSATPKDQPAWDGFFFVYDRTGKEALLSKAILQARSGGTEIPKLTEVTIAGVKALKIEQKSHTTYWAETGKYAVSAADPAVFEDVLNRLAGKFTGSTLAQSDAYQEAKATLTGGLAEFFLRVPQIKEMAGDSGATSEQVRQFMINLKLDAIHVFAGRLSLEGSRTHLQGGILGDTAEGSLFDIWTSGESQPAATAYVTPETIYFTDSQISLLGIYNTVKRALTQPGASTSPLVATLESAAQTRIGMPLPDAFALTSGEFGSLQASPVLDQDKRIYFVGIRSKPDALKLIRTIFSDQLTSERNEGNVTYLKISLKGNQGTKGVAQWNFYHLAMTPNLLFGANKNETLRAALSQASPAGATNLPKSWQDARAQFPEKLNGFSFFDLQKLDWPALKQKWAADIAKNTPASKGANGVPSPDKVGEWLNQVNPAVFPRHLHALAGASWKDATGIHFEEWVD